MMTSECPVGLTSPLRTPYLGTRTAASSVGGRTEAVMGCLAMLTPCGCHLEDSPHSARWPGEFLVKSSFFIM